MSQVEFNESIASSPVEKLSKIIQTVNADFCPIFDFAPRDQQNDILNASLPITKTTRLLGGDTITITYFDNHHSEVLALIDGNTFQIDFKGDWILTDYTDTVLNRGRNLAPERSTYQLYKYEDTTTVMIDKVTGSGELYNTDGSVVHFNKTGVLGIARGAVVALVPRSMKWYDRAVRRADRAATGS